MRELSRISRRALSLLALLGVLTLGSVQLPAWSSHHPTTLGPTTTTIGSVAQAQSGGGFGGRSGGSSSRGGGYSSGRSGGGYSGGGYSGGGYSGGGPIIINNGGWGGGFGGYYGGFGGFSLLPLLLFGVVIFMVIGGMRRAMGNRAQGVGSLGGGNGMDDTAQAVSVQILMAQGDEVKAALQQVARNGDPDSNEGLARMLQEAALVALRHPERWVYGNIERAQGPASVADNQVGSWATEARAAFTDQTTSNYQNNDSGSGYSHHNASFNHDAGDLYLAVTIAVAAYSLTNLPAAGHTTAADARAALGAISSVNPDDLIRAEVVWSPDNEGEFLSEDEAIMKYPKLSKL